MGRDQKENNFQASMLKMINKKTGLNLNSMCNCLRQFGQIRNHPKVYESKFKPTYPTFSTVTNPAAVKSQ